MHVIDNTFSSNPAERRASLSLLALTGAVERAPVVVTPGMVELGTQQMPRERALRRSGASPSRTTSSSSGRPTDAPLSRALPAAWPPVHAVATREDAVAWVRSALEAGDVVLYENDLPDHYPLMASSDRADCSMSW